MNRSIKSIIDSASDNDSIDISYIGKEIWVAHIDTTSIYKNIKLIEIPSNLTELKLGDNLSMSIVQSFILPPFLNTYKGPVFEGMVFPETLETITLIETKNSKCLSKVTLPSVKNLTIQTIDIFSSLDQMKLPPSIEFLKIEGPFNSSIEKLNLENIKELILPDSFIHPLKLNSEIHVLKNNDIDNFSIERSENSELNEINEIITLTPIVNLAIRKYRPFINNLKVVLDDEIPSISHIWFNTLLEGLIEIDTIVVDSFNSKKTLESLDKVFDRSNFFNRKFCNDLFVNNVEVGEINSYLKLASSLKNIGNINIIIHHLNKNINLHGIVKRMSIILNMNYVNGIYYSLFGAVESTLYVNNKTIVIKRGQVPKKFVLKNIEEDKIMIPQSSSTLVVPIDVEGIPPPQKEISLFSWTKCGFCNKQEEIINNLDFKQFFDEKVKVEIVEDPSIISDKRITSFPSWVVNDEIQIGVKNEEQIKEMLDI